MSRRLTLAALIALLTALCSTGLWKLGQCLERLIHTRPRDAAHYNPTYFNRDGAICIARGITAKSISAALETAGIRLRHLKYTLLTGVNTKDSDDVPHDHISLDETAALYIVPTVSSIATQQQFSVQHVSYYLMNQGTTKEERKLAKRAAKLQEHLAVIPARLLSEAMQYGQSVRSLWQLQKDYKLKTSNHDVQ